MPIKPILICSTNPHKLQEYSAITNFYGFTHSFYTLSDVDQQFFCPETGASFLENALQKAQAYQAQIGDAAIYPFLVEDSGLSVDVLDGAPGIFSARYGADHGIASDQERAEFLLENLADLQDHKQRLARYICTTVLYLSPMQYVIAEEFWPGSIAHRYSAGTTGFGYDPVFIPHGFSQPVSTLDIREKHKNSHRARALRRILHAYDAFQD